MASLRKRTTNAAVIPDNVEVAVIPETPPPAPPATASPDVTAQQSDAADVLRGQLDALKQAETMQQQQAIAQLAAEERRRSWFDSTPAAKENHAALNALHHAALDAGLADTSPQYFSFMESQLAALKAQHPAPATHLANEMRQRTAQQQPQPQPPRRVPVSAPVSREVPSSDGRRNRGQVTISPLEREHARVAGITVEEYAKQKLKYEQMRESGQYGEGNQR